MIQRPKACGGLGVRNFKSFNQALLMKNVSRIRQQPQLIVSHVLTSFKARTHRYASQRSLPFGVRGLLHVEVNLPQHCVWKVGNGKLIKAGLDKWVNGRRPKIKDGISLQNSRITIFRNFFLPGTTN